MFHIMFWMRVWAMNVTFFGKTGSCSFICCLMCKSCKHWETKWRFLKDTIGRSIFWVSVIVTTIGLIETSTRHSNWYSKNKTFWKEISNDRWCTVSKCVNNVSDQGLNVSQDLYSVKFILDFNRQVRMCCEFPLRLCVQSVFKNLFND